MNGSAPGVGATAPGFLGLPRRVVSATVGVAERLPVAGQWVQAGHRAVDEVVDDLTVAAAATIRATMSTVVRQVLDVLVTDVDLTALVLENVDLDRIVAHADLDAAVARVDLNSIIDRLDIERILDRIDLMAVIGRVDLMAVIGQVDLDEIVARVDLDRAVTRVDVGAVIDRVDLIGLANDVIDGVDLTGIIRDASTSVTADVMTDVRSTGERADDAVAGIVGRILRRAPEVGPDE